MTARQIAEALAFERVEPSGERRADMRTGYLLEAIAALVGRKSGGRALRWTDWFTEHRDQRRVAEGDLNAMKLEWANLLASVNFTGAVPRN